MDRTTLLRLRKSEVARDSHLPQVVRAPSSSRSVEGLLEDPSTPYRDPPFQPSVLTLLLQESSEEEMEGVGEGADSTPPLHPQTNGGSNQLVSSGGGGDGNLALSRLMSLAYQWPPSPTLRQTTHQHYHSQASNIQK